MNILERIFKKKENKVVLTEDDDRAKIIASALWFGGNLNSTESDQKKLQIDMDDWGIRFE